MKKISTAHILLVIILVMQLAIQVIVKIWGGNLSIVPALLISQLSILVPFIIYCIIKKQNPLKLIRFKKIRVHTVLLSVLIALCSYPVVAFLNLLSMLFVDNVVANIMPQVFSLGFPAAILLMALIPAIVEETIFRGLVYNTYSKRKPIAGIVLSALLFGLMHMNFNQMPYAMYLGIIMALLMEACDTIVAPMVLHFTMNGASTVISFLTKDTMSEVTAGSSMNFKDMMMESYQISASQSGMAMSEEQIATMMPIIMVFTIGVLAIFAIGALALVLALIRGVFSLNHRKPADVFKADHSDTAYVEGRRGKIRKNRMIDVFVICFIIYTTVMCFIN